MAQAAPIQTSFNAGEVDPLTYGRVDYERMRSGLVVCKNLIPRVTGSITRRPATYFCDEVKDSTKATRCYKFKYSTIQAYILEFGDQYIRFKKNHAPVYDLTLTITGITQATPGVVTYTSAAHDLTLTITGVTQANPGVVTYTGTDPANGDQVDISGVVGMTELNGNRYKVANVNTGANTFELQTTAGVNVDTSAYTAYGSAGIAERVLHPTAGQDVDITSVAGMTEVNTRRYRVGTVTTGATNTFQLLTVTGSNVNTSSYTAYTSGGSAKRVYTLTSPYLEADLFQLKFTQNADTMYIWHPDYAERTLVRTSDSSWTLASSVLVDGPYLPENTTATTLTPSAATGAITVTASAVTGINDGQGFLSTDVGRLIRMKQGSVWGYCQITGWTSTTVVSATVVNTLTSVAAKTVWRMGLYSATTGYPACGSFFGDRLYRGGVPYVPDRVDGSKVSDYLNMAPTATDGTVTDEHAVSFRLNSDDVQQIRWMRGMSSGLAVGTFEGEWIVMPSVNEEAITPTNINAKQATSWGSADTMALRVGTVIVFIESGSRRVRELNYLFYENTFSTPDMTILASHITKGGYDPAEPDAGASTTALSGLVEIDFCKKPIPSLWAVRNDGVLIGATYHKDEKVLGWHRHIMGGWSNAGKTAHAEVESVTIIPSSDGSADEVWLVVKRYINGRTVRYNEFMQTPWEQGTPQEDAFFVDCGLTYDGTATDTISGLYHLAGEAIQVLVDGAEHPDVTVSATGTITLDYEASVVHAGYLYESDGQCLRFDVGAMDGTSQGKIQRSHKIIFRLHDTLGMSVGPSFDELDEVIFRSADDVMGDPPPLFSGDKDDFTWPGDYTTENYVCWRFNKPLPGEILAIMPRLHTQDGL